MVGRPKISSSLRVLKFGSTLCGATKKIRSVLTTIFSEVLSVVAEKNRISPIAYLEDSLWTIADFPPTVAGGFRFRRLNNENPFKSATEQSSLLLWPTSSGAPQEHFHFSKMEVPLRKIGRSLWTIADLNRSPHPCHGCALPDELMALAEPYDYTYF